MNQTDLPSSLVNMYKVIECKTSHFNHCKIIGEALADVPQYDDILIISREKEAIKANKYLLSVFSPALSLPNMKL